MKFKGGPPMLSVIIEAVNNNKVITNILPTLLSYITNNPHCLNDTPTRICLAYLIIKLKPHENQKHVWPILKQKLTKQQIGVIERDVKHHLKKK